MTTILKSRPDCETCKKNNCPFIDPDNAANCKGECGCKECGDSWGRYLESLLDQDRQKERDRARMNIAQDTYYYQGKRFPDYLKRGAAADHVFPFAKHFCKGRGLDIGGRKECHFPGSIIVNPEYGSAEPPAGPWDYIFSSHCLEHIPDYITALETWRDLLRPGGQLFLYLPHPAMPYWRPENCRKHVHEFTPDQIARIMQHLGFIDVFFTPGHDLYWSFAVTGVKQ